MRLVTGHRVQGWALALALHLGLLGWLFLGEAPPPRAVAKRPPVRVLVVSRQRPTLPPQAISAQPPREPERAARPPRSKRPAPKTVAREQAARPAEPSRAKPSAASSAPPPPGTPRFQVSLSATVPGGGVAVPTAPAGAPGRSVGVPRWAEGPAAAPAPPAATATRPIDASDASRVPELLAQPNPDDLRRAYPESARAAGLEANVVLRILVSTEGRVLAVKIVKGAGNGFDEAAQRLVRGFRFRAGVRDGKTVSVWIPWTYKFRLNG